MDRVPGHAWLMVLAAAVLVLVASAVPLAPDGSALARVVGQVASATYPTVNLWRVAGVGIARRYWPPAPAVLLSPPPVHPVLDRGLVARVGVDVPCGASDRSQGTGHDHGVRRVSVSRDPERALLCDQCRCLPVEAGRATRLRARPARGAVLVCARADGARHLGGLCARARPDCRRAGGRRRRSPHSSPPGPDARRCRRRHLVPPDCRIARLGHPARRLRLARPERPARSPSASSSTCSLRSACS